MEDDLVGYLLDCLDEEAAKKVEARLAQDVELRRRLDVVRQALAPLAADAAPIEPPPDLAARTLMRVAESARRLPVAPRVRSFAASARSFWRRSDALVAACLLVTVLGLALPAILHLRSGAARSECQNNLRTFFTALEAYHDRHGNFPNVQAEAPHNVAGLVVPILIDAGTLSADMNIRCPGVGAPQSCPFTLEQIRAMSQEEFQRHAAALSGCYAYSLGYQDQEGYFCPSKQSELPGSIMPIMADALPPSDGSNNSPNHAGKGQNVLFLDGSARFFTVRRVGADDDLYFNKVQKMAAGLGRTDFVLGHSASSP